MEARKASCGRSAANQWWASSPAAPAGLGSASSGRSVKHDRIALVVGAPFGRQQARLDDLGQQGMARSQGLAARIQDQDAAIDGGPDRLTDGLLGQVGDRREQAFIHRPAAHGHDAQDRLAGVRQRPDLGRQRLGQRARQGPGAAGAFALHEFLDEVRIAARPPEDPFDQVVGGRRVQARLELPGHPLAIERGEVQADGRRVALQARQPGRHRITAVEAIRADGQHDEHPLLIEVAGQEPHEVLGRPVHPVQVLDHEHAGSIGARAIRAAPGRARTGGPGPGWRSGRPSRWAPSRR